MSSRSSNFSLQELNVLLTALENMPDLVSGELGKAIKTVADQNQEWNNIAKLISACGIGNNRTATQVRNKWRDIKYRTKKKLRDFHHESLKTGGGPPPNSTSFSEFDERVLALMGTTCITGIASCELDSSARELKVQSPLMQDGCTDNSFLSLPSTSQQAQQDEMFLEVSNDNVHCPDVSNTTPSWHLRNKRKCSSTDRVRRLRWKRTNEDRVTEEEVIDRQKKMLDKLSSIENLLSQHLTNQIITNKMLEKIVSNSEHLSDVANFKTLVNKLNILVGLICSTIDNPIPNE